MPASQPIELGRRIVVWGATGAGKTTVTRAVGQVKGLPVIELDAIRHAGGWDAVDYAEMRDVLRERLDACPDGWVVDGSYSAIHDVYLPSADTLIWLHLPWRVSFWRLFKRTVSRAWAKQPAYEPDGPYESWRTTFLSRRSILWWSISHHRIGVRNARERIGGLRSGVRVCELRSAREVREFFATLGVETKPPSSEPSMTV